MVVRRQLRLTRSLVVEDAEPVKAVVVPVAGEADVAIGVVQDSASGKVFIFIELALVDGAIAEVVFAVLFVPNEVRDDFDFVTVRLGGLPVGLQCLNFSDGSASHRHFIEDLLIWGLVFRVVEILVVSHLKVKAIPVVDWRCGLF